MRSDGTPRLRSIIGRITISVGLTSCSSDSGDVYERFGTVFNLFRSCGSNSDSWEPSSPVALIVKYYYYSQFGPPTLFAIRSIFGYNRYIFGIASSWRHRQQFYSSPGTLPRGENGGERRELAFARSHSPNIRGAQIFACAQPRVSGNFYTLIQIQNRRSNSSKITI